MIPAVVIGAGCGDEGKGLVTDWLCANHFPTTRRFGPPVNVRYCGSAQAGHTVVTPAGQRVVTHHVGAGVLTGAPTWLGPEFVAHPMVLARELESLSMVEPAVYASPRCPVATPYDVLVNQEIERARGVARHGSCGLGINETLQREAAGVTFHVSDIMDTAVHRWDVWADRLREIRLYYPQRLSRLGLLSLNERVCDNPLWRRLQDRFIEDLDAFRMTVRQSDTVVEESAALVFEGSQGLRLDRESPDFPHVTNARTGIAPVMELLPRHTEVDAFYVTRCYTTRHGAGPLANECALPYRIVDQTNLPNAWQGSLRFAPLDLDRLAHDILDDVMDVLPRRVNVHVVMTCVDQLDGQPVWLVDGRTKPYLEVLAELGSRVGAVGVWWTNGPTRDHVRGGLL